MTPPILPLFATNLRGWLSTKGFVLVAAAALLPLALTGAWAATHRADLAAGTPTWEPATVVEGTNVTFRAVVTNAGGQDVGAFNATLAVGSVFGSRFVPEASNVTAIEGLDAGEERALVLAWTAQPGTYFVLLDVDPTDPSTQEDDVGEIDEFNNQRYVPLVVGYAPGAEGPSPPGNLTGAADAATLADLEVALDDAAKLAPRDNATFVARVANDGPQPANATVTFRVARPFGDRFFAAKETTQQVALEPGETRDLELPWTAQEGAYWLEAWANLTGNATDPEGANNHAAKAFTVDPVVDPDVKQPEPPERLTLKVFYLNILQLLHLTVLVPLIALFYAAGVITDERERGTLPYLLTRPVPRVLIPMAKFVASFAVAAIALTIGVLGTYLVVFGALPTEADATMFYVPLAVSLVALLVYGLLFVVFGVWTDRPYLVGIAFVLGWEIVAPMLLPWVENLTLRRHVANLLVGWWDPEAVAFRALPEGPDVGNAIRVLAIAAVAFVLLTSYVMKRKEFEV